MEHIRRYRVGRATVTRITEMALPEIPFTFLFPSEDPAILSNETPSWITTENTGADGSSVTLNVHSWIVQIEGQTIMIDTGAGNGKHRPLNPVFDQLDTPWLKRLAAAGIRPSDVDFVLITHLHVDHVGWNTFHDGEKWIPTFPNAKYIFSAAEYEFYGDENHVQSPSLGVFTDSVQPVIDAGQAVLVDFEQQSTVERLTGFTFHRTKGHSFDHLSIELSSEGEYALFPGDVMHHPVQIARPEWNSTYCEFPADAYRSRLWALNHAVETNALFFSSHFPGTSAGRVERGEYGFSWVSQ